MSGTPRVRFAPSPTGYLHVGGARTALFNWLFARGHGGVFVLRIEDTDRERSSEEMTRAILDGMAWLGLEWDEGPFYQADGFARHRAEALRLLDQGAAYRCFCTAEQLEVKRRAMAEEYRYDRTCCHLSREDSDRRAAAGEPFAIRFRVPDGTTEWDDAVHGPTRFANADIEDFVIVRSEGTPTYNLAVVSDDVEMRITHVIRGDDHISNTPKQILLYQALGAAVPAFAHLPMILGPDGKRLSKRHGATSVGEYREQGILPEGLDNFLALLGWNPGDEQEIMTLADLVARFSIERVNKKSAVFDPEKLLWMNGQHISRMTGAELLDLAAPRLVEAGLATPEEIADRHDWFAGLMDLLKPRARTLDGFAPQARAYLAEEVEYETAGVEKHWKDREQVAERLRSVEAALAALPDWTPEAVEAALRRTAERLGVGFGKIVHPLRLALTGATVSPGIDAVVAHMGPDLVRRRIEQALAVL
ncbi:MAG TPA: glutamate--tRNA ligase [Longimicrobiaceae bacterium]|nr:glutamate--tRNA ligase [Longimicrobiaceae bacterium]